MSSVGAALWRLRLAHWSLVGRQPESSSTGYALLLPVPGDLPVFTHLALAGLRRQVGADRVETIVIPDRPDPAVSALIADAAPSWSGPLREVLIRHPERELLPRLGNAGRNHGWQIATGVTATRASHVVLHDADLFLADADAHDRQFRYARDHALDALGISPAWDPWFAARGRHLAATWEMVARTDWIRASPPWRLQGHEDVALGERHVLDTTFWAQLHTDPSRIEVHDDTGGVVHFNYLISAFRAYATTAETYWDEHFALLVIRVLSDLFAVGVSDRLPDLTALTAMLDSSAGPVTYQGCTDAEYARVRGELAAVLAGPWAGAAARESLADLLGPFDRRFGWEAAAAPVSAAASAPAPADVTVVIPVRDRSTRLPATLAAVLAQVPPPAEVVVVDDASADDSADVAEQFGATVLRRETSGGAGPARNDGIAAASTTWVAFCDSDDVWTQGHLANLLRAAGEGDVLVSAPARVGDGGWLGNVLGRDVRVDVTGLLAPGVNLVASGSMVRREVALSIGGFRPLLSEDLDLWLRLLEHGTALLTAHPTVLYARHAGQLSATSPVVAEAERLVAALADRPWSTAALQRQWRTQLRWDELRTAMRSRDAAAAREALAALTRHPDQVLAVGRLLRQRRQLRRRQQSPMPSAAGGSSVRSGESTPPNGGQVLPRA